MSFADRIAESDIRAVLGYWLTKRRNDAVPAKRDIDPKELPPRILPWLFIYRREGDGRLRCILSGTGIGKIDGYDVTGRFLDEIVPLHAVKNRTRLFAETLEQAMPIYFQGRYVLPGRSSRSFSRLLLPLSTSSDYPDCVFGIVAFREPGPMSRQEERSPPGEPSLVVHATPDDLVAPPTRGLLSA